MVVPRPTAIDANIAQLEVLSELRGAACTISVTGEIDLATVHQLDDALHGDWIAGVDTVLVDLRGVRFIDSTGLCALVNAQHRLRDRRCRLVLLRPPDPVFRTFEISGLTQTLAFASDVPGSGDRSRSERDPAF